MPSSQRRFAACFGGVLLDLARCALERLRFSSTRPNVLSSCFDVIEAESRCALFLEMLKGNLAARSVR